MFGWLLVMFEVLAWQLVSERVMREIAEYIMCDVKNFAICLHNILIWPSLPK
jgi:hypothetical protein